MDNCAEVRRDGVLYIAFNLNRKADYLEEVKYSVRTLKNTNPYIGATLFTDKVIIEDDFEKVTLWRFESERVKHEYLYLSPYLNTIYLDTDTKIVGKISSLFKLMKRFDIAAVHDHVRVKEERNKIWNSYNLVPESFPELAGGVIVFRKSKEVENFFKVWRENYKIWYDLTGKINDQPSFRVSLWQCNDLKFYVLPQEYNIRTQSKRDKFDNIKHKIYHWHDQFNHTVIGTPQKF